MAIDPLQLSIDLIRAKSVTPDPGCAMDVLEHALTGLGFTCHRLVFSEKGTDDVPNLYARLGDCAPNICFAGHTDVVPTGAIDQWSDDPFAGTVRGGDLYGRGASDMKAAIACFVSAVERLIGTMEINGSISLLITGDEEGPAINGTKKVLDWMQENGEPIDYCIVGEPTNPAEMGDMIKIGRRGSMHGMIKVHGIQGHVAYPHLGRNPIPDLVKLLAALEAPLDGGNDHFQPSNLEVVNIHVGNESHNVIPAEVFSRFNVRFNSQWSPESLQAELLERIDSAGIDPDHYEIDWWVSGDSFITEPCLLTDHLVAAIETVLGRTPELSTTGGTSDARFIKNMCPVVEFGLIGATMHKVDEHVPVSSIHQLSDIYHEFLKRMLG